MACMPPLFAIDRILISCDWLRFLRAFLPLVSRRLSPHSPIRRRQLKHTARRRQYARPIISGSYFGASSPISRFPIRYFPPYRHFPSALVNFQGNIYCCAENMFSGHAFARRRVSIQAASLSRWLHCQMPVAYFRVYHIATAYFPYRFLCFRSVMHFYAAATVCPSLPPRYDDRGVRYEFTDINQLFSRPL